MNRLLPLTLLLTLVAGRLDAADWLHWRGPEQNGVSREKDLPETWSPDPKAPNNNLIWKVPYGCRSTPLVMNGRVYIINDCDEGINEQERVMCFDAATGKLLWEHRFNIFFTDIVSSRVGWTNLAGDAETGNVYAHGVQGFLFCFDRDGKILWQRSLTEEYGRVTGYGGRVTSPIVDGDLVILGMVNASWGDHARGANRFVAFDKKTGTPVWWSEMPNPLKGTYYSVPVVTIINGQRLLITGGADGYIHALKVRTGELVWSYPISLQAINASPVVDGTRVYITNGEENFANPIQGCVVCLDAGQIENGQPKLVWRVDGIKAGYASPIIHEGRLYVCDDTAKMFCFDALTGKVLWSFKYGRLSRGSPVWADGKIYVAEVNAKFHILKPGPKRCEELHEQFFPSPDGKSFVETNGTPAVVDGRVYFANRDNLFCIGKKDRRPSADPIPAPPTEEPADPKAKPTFLQVVPADVVASAGSSVTFRARLYDAQGRFLRETAAQWMLPTPPPAPGSTVAPPPLRGTMNDGTLVLAKDVPFQQGYVKAQAEGLSGQARVRVVPATLPIRPNFDKIPEGRPPSGWVNAAGKYTIVRLPDGSAALKKLANDARPPLARANAYIALPTLSHYVIQADVMGTKVRDNMPDVGIVNCRYTLMLDGNKQQLRIVSWEALPRIDRTIAWEWKPNTWYTAKLVVDLQGDKAVVRGKVWPRGQPEPSAWSIEVTDPKPNRQGSPAVYAYATGILEDAPGAEAFFQNVIIEPAP
ncbi:MAG: PQQ-binding-like beta-propeller repeat protein [Gemmataceae bacterium]|nr:PQQ-binding-like beta-propeller repeat protein [Gemmataceae bacterium]MDW8263760.1 PQQ-binding-like beta-propeller repeat protein [Gemmataceae bacterium]